MLQDGTGAETLQRQRLIGRDDAVALGGGAERCDLGRPTYRVAGKLIGPVPRLGYTDMRGVVPDRLIFSAFRSGCAHVSLAVTHLIQRSSGGDDDARRSLWSLVYDELHSLAASQMRRERAGHTLQPTALVHEVYVRLLAGAEAQWESRAHFFGVAAEAMRRILVDHARRRNTARKGGGRGRVSMTHVLADEQCHGAGAWAMLDEVQLDLEALDVALKRLAATGKHARKCEVVNLRFFVGLTIEQTAQVLGVAPASVKRDWDFAKAWLNREIQRSEQSE